MRVYLDPLRVLPCVYFAQPDLIEDIRRSNPADRHRADGVADMDEESRGGLAVIGRLWRDFGVIVSVDHVVDCRRKAGLDFLFVPLGLLLLMRVLAFADQPVLLQR